MNFDLSEDEQLLKALAERFVADRYDTERRRAYLTSEHGFSSENWTLLGELGLLAAPIAADHGGLGLDATAISTIFAALGKGMVVEPVIENIVVTARLLATTAPPSLRDDWLPDVMQGTRRLAFAHAEQGGRGGRLWVSTRASSDGDDTLLDGAKLCVPAGGGCDAYIVSARTSGAEGDPDGVDLYLVDSTTPGLTVTPWRMADGSVAVSLALVGVRVPADRKLSGGMEAVASIEDLACLARSAEALGIMQALFDETLDYLRTRQQFGNTLGSFQAIQHRMVAQYTAIEQGRALLDRAIVSDGTPDFAVAVRGARAFISPASIELGHEMIQFHGGMGVSDELAIGQGHKRLLVLSRWPDDPTAALDCYADLAA